MSGCGGASQGVQQRLGGRPGRHVCTHAPVRPAGAPGAALLSLAESGGEGHIKPEMGKLKSAVCNCCRQSLIQSCALLQVSMSMRPGEWQSTEINGTVCTWALR
eukprot:jgi/Ulvmu1/9982/UM059_0031.1